MLHVFDLVDGPANKHLSERDPLDVYLIQVPSGQLFLTARASNKVRLTVHLLLPASLLIIFVVLLPYVYHMVSPLVALEVNVILRIQRQKVARFQRMQHFLGALVVNEDSFINVAMRDL